jgi:hypothetical protein
LNYLDNMGLYIGSRIKILEYPTQDSYLRLEIAGKEHILGRKLAEQMLVVEI